MSGPLVFMSEYIKIDFLVTKIIYAYTRRKNNRSITLQKHVHFRLQRSRTILDTIIITDWGVRLTCQGHTSRIMVLTTSGNYVHLWCCTSLCPFCPPCSETNLAHSWRALVFLLILIFAAFVFCLCVCACGFFFFVVVLTLLLWFALNS
jgi:hypothetical protein